MPVRFDLNADVGEGFPSDAELMQIITQANVACGFHAGDMASMRELCQRAVTHGVAVGAQVSYRDREGFGRRAMDVSHDVLVADLDEQVAALRSVATSSGASVTYLKPHGALYNRVVTDDEQARAVVQVCQASELPLLCLAGSAALAQAERAGIPVLREFFADRAYDAVGHLVPRDVVGAVLTDPDEVGDRLRHFLATGSVTSIDGQTVEVEADSICVHGDTPGAVTLARAARDALGLAMR
jgi:5-oxoprolinase (ATP-hydrolysing) subunit A